MVISREERSIRKFKCNNGISGHDNQERMESIDLMHQPDTHNLFNQVSSLSVLPSVFHQLNFV